MNKEENISIHNIVKFVIKKKKTIGHIIYGMAKINIWEFFVINSYKFPFAIK